MPDTPSISQMPTDPGFQPTGLNVAQDSNPFLLINKGIAWAIILAFILSVFFIFYGGISFILSGGKEDKIKKAVSTIRYAIIGLVVTLLATTIISIVGRIFGYNFIGEIINFGQIFNDIRSIVESFTSGGGGSSSSSQLVIFLLS